MNLTEKSKRGRSGAEYKGEYKPRFLWKPYLPIGEYIVYYGESGVGKTFGVSLDCAYVTQGWTFPLDYLGDDGGYKKQSRGYVLYISAEESFEEICDRLVKCGGDPNYLIVIDRSESVGLNIKDGFEELEDIVRTYKPRLIVLDPWQAFLGDAVNPNWQNHLRPILQKIALLAGEGDCSLILIAHVNKGDHGQNANDKAAGSKELINASRSAITVIEDENDENRRIAVHTKANKTKRGESICFRFESDGTVKFDGVSNITKTDLEKASRAKTSVGELKKSKENFRNDRARLIDALIFEAKNTEKCGKRLSYEDVKSMYGNDIFGSVQPKIILDSIVEDLLKRGITLETGKTIRRGSTTKNGFFIQKISPQ